MQAFIAIANVTDPRLCYWEDPETRTKVALDTITFQAADYLAAFYGMREHLATLPYGKLYDYRVVSHGR